MEEAEDGRRAAVGSENCGSGGGSIGARGSSAAASSSSRSLVGSPTPTLQELRRGASLPTTHSGGGGAGAGGSSTRFFGPSSSWSSSFHRGLSAGTSGGSSHAPPPRLQQLRRRHTHTGHHHHHHHGKDKHMDGGIGLLRRLKTSFRLELEEHGRGPSLGRIGSGWDSPAPFPDAVLPLPDNIPHFDPESSEAKALCVPGTGWRHKLLLASAACVGFGGYFARTILSAVSADLIVDFGMTRETYGALSGLPAIPNIVFGPLGGAVVDWLGADKSCLLYSLIVVLGSALSSVAVPLRSTKLLGLSQVFLGVGKGTLGTAQKVFLKLATDHDEVSFYFALAFSVSHLGTFLAFFISPAIAKSAAAGYAACVYFATGVALVSLLCTFPLLGKLKHIQPLLSVLDTESDEEEAQDEEEGIELTETGTAATVAAAAAAGAEEGEEGSPALRTIYSGQEEQAAAAGAASLVGGVRGEEEETKEEAAAGAGPAVAPDGGGGGGGGNVTTCAASVARGLAGARAVFFNVFGDLLTLPFLLFLAACLFYYLSFVPFESWGVYYLAKERLYDSGHASLGTSMIPVASVFLGPAFGALVDKELWKKGNPGPRFRTFYPPGATQLIGMLMTAAGILVVYCAPRAWAVGFGLVSLAYAMVCSALWILIPEFVPIPSLGLAFSVVHAINDVLLMVFETQIGRLLDEGNTFQDTVLPIMLGFAGLATLATLVLMRPLRKRAEWNAALAEAALPTCDEAQAQQQQGQQVGKGVAAGGRGTVGELGGSSARVLGSLGASLGDMD